MIAKGKWIAIESINNFFVVTGKGDSIRIAKCYQNKENAELIAHAKIMYGMLKEVSRHEDKLEHLPADLVNDINKIVKKFKKK